MERIRLSSGPRMGFTTASIGIREDSVLARDSDGIIHAEDAGGVEIVREIDDEHDYDFVIATFRTSEGDIEIHMDPEAASSLGSAMVRAADADLSKEAAAACVVSTAIKYPEE